MRCSRKSSIGATLSLFVLLFSLSEPALGENDLSLETARAAAEKGDAKAQYFLGKCYAKGREVQQDYTKAAAYLLEAAEQGHAYAQNDLGVLYAKGLGVKQDYAEAAKWYRKAAEQGDALAQYSTGRAYAEGRGVPKDVPESLKWYQKAAEQEQTDALLALGTIYLNGEEGIKQDYHEAFSYFQKAAGQGRYDAFNSLGYLYEHGLGVDQRPEKAVKCYREAAERCDGRAQMNLGRMYLDGSGVERDLIESYKWFILARENGELTVQKYLRDFETSDVLKPEEMAEANGRADKFREKVRKTKPKD